MIIIVTSVIEFKPLIEGLSYLAGNLFFIDFFQIWITLIILIIIALSSISAFYEISSKRSTSLKNFLILNSILTIMLTATNNIFYFFIMFEMAILPIFLIIIGWGYQPEKIEAAIVIFFYTLVGSVPLNMFILYQFSGSLNIFFIQRCAIALNNFYGSTLAFTVLIRFLVKFPVYCLHLWLPLAHVEAPVYGSMILAGILLKLGGIGIARFIIFISSVRVVNLVCLLALLRTSLIRLTCIQTTDIKKIIAFSSVAHIRFRIILISVSVETTVISRFIILIVHAFRSSGIFFLIYVFYTSSNSRNLILNSGVLRGSPLFRFLWLILLISSLGGPPAINLLVEIICIIGLLTFFSQFFLAIFIGFMVARAYHFVLYSSLCQGKSSWENLSHKLTTHNGHFYLVRVTHVFYTIYNYALISYFFN